MKKKDLELFHAIFALIKSKSNERPPIVARIRQLIKNSTDPTAIISALMWAVMHSDEEAIREILPQPPLELKNINHREIKSGNTVLTSLLSQARKPENQGKNYLSMFEMLIGAGADPTLFDNQQFTPLIKAAEQLNLKICQLLLTYPSVCSSIDFANKRGINALIAAVISASNAQHPARKRGLEIIAALIQANSNVSHSTNTGNTALFYAALSADGPMIKLLLGSPTSKGSINAQNDNKNSPLQAAVEKCARDCEIKDTAKRDRYKDTLRLLLEADADPKLANAGGYTPLIIAALHRENDLAALLLAHKEAPKFIDLNTEFGHSALTCAADTGNKEMVQMLSSQYKIFVKDITSNLWQNDIHLLIMSVRSCINHHILRLPVQGKKIGRYRDYQECIEYIAAQFDDLLNRIDNKGCTAFYYICRAVQAVQKQKNPLENYRRLGMLGALLAEKKADTTIGPFTPRYILKKHSGIEMEDFLQMGREEMKKISSVKCAFLPPPPVALIPPAPPVAAAASGAPQKTRNWAQLVGSSPASPPHPSQNKPAASVQQPKLE